MQVTIWPRGTARVYEAATSGANAQHMTDFGELLEVEFSTRYESGFGGHDLATVKVKPFGGFLGGLFRPGDHSKIVKGGGTCFEGEVSGVRPSDDETVEILLKGYGYNLADYESIYFESVPLAPDISYPTNQLVGGNMTSTWFGWEYAVDVAGMPIAQVVGTIPTGSFGESPVAEQPVKIDTLVTAMTQEDGDKWAVWNRTIVIAPDDNAAVWAYDAPTGLVGVEDTDYFSHVGVWHVVSGGPDPWLVGTSYPSGGTVEYGGLWWESLSGSNLANTPVDGSSFWKQIPKSYTPANFLITWAGDNSPETDGMAWGNTPVIHYFDTRQIVVDYRGLGKIDANRARELGEALWQQVKGRFVMSGTFTVGPESGFRSASGGVADIAFPRAGQAVQMNQLRTAQGTLMPDSTFIIGRTEYRWSLDGTESLSVTPMGTVARDMGELLRGVPLDAASVVSGAAPAA